MVSSRKLAGYCLAAFLVLPGMAVAATRTVTNLSDLNALLTGGAASGDILVFDRSGAGPLEIALTGSIAGTIGGLTLDGGVAGGERGKLIGDDTFGLIKMSGIALNALRNIEFHKGNASGSLTFTNGGLWVGAITGGITNSVFSGNKSFANGGGLRVDTVLTGGVADSAFIGNSLSVLNGDGGGMYVVTFNGDLTKSTFSNNRATHGGGMYANAFNGDIAGSSFSNNRATKGGGAFLGAFDGSMVDSAFADNTASSGAGMFVAGVLTGDIANSEFSGNIADLEGGGINAGEFNADITGSSFTNNSAQVGGGMYAGAFKGGIADSSFSNNTAASDGGGMHVVGIFDGNITNSTLSYNVADNGGGMFADAFNGDITNSSFSNNHAEGIDGGGGLFVTNAFTGNVTDSVFRDNGGGGLHAGSFTGIIANSMLHGNSTGFNLIVPAGVTMPDDSTFNLGDSGGADIGGGGFSGGITNSTFSDNSINFNFNVGSLTLLGNGPDIIGGGGGMDVNGAFNGDITGSVFSGNRVNFNLTADNSVTGNLPDNDGGGGGGMNVKGAFNGDIIGSTFSGNSTNLNLTAGSVNGNITGSSGGGMLVGGAFTGDIKGSTFSGNRAALNLTAGSVSGNVAGGSGGGMYVGGPFTGDISRSVFSGNSAGSHGGGLFVAANFSGGISDSHFTGNAAGGNGGALYFAGAAAAPSKIAFNNTRFSGNHADGLGGALYFAMPAAPSAKYEVSFSADSGRDTSFANNTQGRRRNSFHVVGEGKGSFAARVDGYGTVAFYDPFTADIPSGRFSLTHDSVATLIMSGVNTVRAANVGFVLDGTVKAMATPATGGDFSLVAGGGDVNVTMGRKLLLTMFPSTPKGGRDSSVPLFDLSGSAGEKTFGMADGATLDLSRQLAPLAGDRFLLARGLDPDADTVTLGRFAFMYPGGGEETAVFSGTDLWLENVNVPDAFRSGAASPNLIASQDGAANWLNDTAAGLALTPRQVMALRDDFDSAPPEAAADAALTALDIHDAVTRSARDGLLGRGPESARAGSFRFWGNYLLAGGRVRSRGGYSGYNLDSNGGLFGASWAVFPGFTLGGYFGHANSDADFRDIRAGAEFRTNQGGVQAVFRGPEGLRIMADAAYSRHDAELARNPGGLGGSAGEFSQDVFSADAEIAYEFAFVNGVRLTPSLSVGAARVRQDAFTERGPVLAARVDALSGSRVESRLGGALERDWRFARGELTPGLGLYWNHLYTGRRFGTTYGFVDNDGTGLPPHAVRSREAGADSLELSAHLGGKLEMRHAEWTFHGGYGMRAGRGAVEHRFQLGMGMNF